MLIMGLSSRRNLCVHPRVKQEKYARVVDSKCRNMTAPWVRDAAGAGISCRNQNYAKFLNFFYTIK